MLHYDEMLHNVAFHQGLHVCKDKTKPMTEMHRNFKNSTRDTLK